MHIAEASAPGAQAAELSYRILANHPEAPEAAPRSTALLEVHLLTGRKHQIRVQLAHAGWPIVGAYRR